MVSFREGERPTREQLADIEDRLCGALGFAEHQRVSAVHQNTDNWHMHIAINKVHPRTPRSRTRREKRAARRPTLKPIRASRPFCNGSVKTPVVHYWALETAGTVGRTAPGGEHL